VIASAIPSSCRSRARKGGQWAATPPRGTVILHYWTVTMFVPAVLLIIVALATITRMVDD
jgi:hypothetical protein